MYEYADISNSQWETFFKALRKAQSISSACTKAGINRRTAYRWRETIPSIAARWEDALKAGVEYLEDAAVKRAVKGVDYEKGIYYKGVRVGTEIETRYSDNLLALLLKGRDPKYKDNPNLLATTIVSKELERIFDILRNALSVEDYQKVIALIADDSATDSITTLEGNYTAADE